MGVSVWVYLSAFIFNHSLIQSFIPFLEFPECPHRYTDTLIHYYPVLSNLRLMLYTSARIVKAKATSTSAYWFAMP